MSSEHDLNADASEETTETDVKIQGKSNGNDTSRSRLAGNVTVGTIAEARSGAPADKDGGDPSRPFMYRDFGHIAEEDFDADYELDQEGLLQVSPDSSFSLLGWMSKWSPFFTHRNVIGFGRIDSLGGSTSDATVYRTSIVYASRSESEYNKSIWLGPISTFSCQVICIVKSTKFKSSHYVVSWVFFS